jgi:prepilin-type N-terminal cleavage/methylation domain-containing protein
MRLCSNKVVQQGLTLVEVMVAMALGSIVLATVGSLSFYGARSSIAVINYTDLDAKSRYALDVIGRELRGATGVTGVNTTTNTKSFTLTNATAGGLVTVAWDPDRRTVVLQRPSQAPLTALTECDRFEFGLYQRTPYVTASNVLFYPATNFAGAQDLNLCKLISLSWKCSRTILTQKVNTESVQAAQIVLRNKQ